MATRLFGPCNNLVASFLLFSRGHHFTTSRASVFGSHRALQKTLDRYFNTRPGIQEKLSGIAQASHQGQDNGSTFKGFEALLEVVSEQFKWQDTQNEKYELLLQNYIKLQHEHNCLHREKRELEGRLSLRSALELITHKAVMLGILTGPEARGGVSQRLEALAATDQFKLIIEKEAEDRGLVAKNVRHQASHIYHELSKWVHNTDGSILIGPGGFTSNERAVLACFLRLQENWPVPIEWDEEGR